MALRAAAAAHTTLKGSFSRPYSSVLFSKRWQHSTSKSSFSSYEYPLRNEAPVVTRTTAADAAASASATEPTATKSKSPPADSEDRFDDGNTLNHLEAMARRQAQEASLQKSLSRALPITDTPPSSIPKNMDTAQLEIPTTQLSTLDNGIQVVSQETYGQVTTVGVLGAVGSKMETQSEIGISHLSELLQFSSSTQSYNSTEIQQLLQNWGGASFANFGREQFLTCIDVLRPNVKLAMNLLQDVVLHPQFRNDEVEDCKQAIEFQTMDIMPEIVLGEALQRAAYGPNQPLGQAHFCPPDALPRLNADGVRKFWSHHIWNNPQALVVAGAGIQHDELVQMSQDLFGHLQQEKQTVVPDSKYSGGQHFVKHISPMDNLTRIAISLEVGGWHSDDLVPTCVLQTLLGGGNSFSAGGPGKGMYSRLYRQVLNRYSWAESAEAFTAFHNESGLWGMSGSTDLGRVRDLARVLTDHFLILAHEAVSDEELDRARNMLKCNVLTQLESRLVLFEDIGRQVLTYGHRETTEEMCRKIEAVTKQDLQQLARNALEGNPPTIAAVGPQEVELMQQYVPSQQEVQSWMS